MDLLLQVRLLYQNEETLKGMVRFVVSVGPIVEQLLIREQL